MTVAQSTAFQGAASTGRRDYLDTGTGNAKIQIYSGVRPTPGGAPSGDLLVTVILAKPCGTVDAGVLTLEANDPDGELITTTGAATWARFVNGNDDWAFDADVSQDGGTGEVQFPNINLYAGGRAPLSPSTIG